MLCGAASSSGFVCLKRACDVVTTFAVAGNWLFYAFLEFLSQKLSLTFCQRHALSLVKFHEIYKDTANIFDIRNTYCRCLVISIRLYLQVYICTQRFISIVCSSAILLKSPGGQGRFTIARWPRLLAANNVPSELTWPWFKSADWQIYERYCWWKKSGKLTSWGWLFIAYIPVVAGFLPSTVCLCLILLDILHVKRMYLIFALAYDPVSTVDGSEIQQVTEGMGVIYSCIYWDVYSYTKQCIII